ncbi:periplasmic glucans biosynthesis protein MdoG [Cellvibrio japonicus Ueda107]|uniref:Glucans biosynthesis protein G n=1 Tax=Cellvibrio japonicus (strain Ueda107) TaxID=498211 RepID=B3PI19_CELJU|nr:periplasmic glucans biosynthesis protein MdoG [Cellvibrio japonicus Ueda107]QEI11071.1 glucan biosynthesis protein [Cellvibrio japonicus]QEI14645.1 glucan biosynthesis protein [Cellvibrio japonicus]QEI18225.1 glucan biosynthesis protein [Cellvibrio japonicus]
MRFCLTCKSSPTQTLFLSRRWLSLCALPFLLWHHNPLAQIAEPPKPNPVQESATLTDIAKPGLFDALSERARKLAKHDYEPIHANIPSELADMDYDQYRAIRFRPEAALWRGQSLFEIQLFHPGFLYREPIILHTAGDTPESVLQFKQAFFNYDGPAAPLAGLAPGNIGFAGFRVHYPLNSNEYKDEFLVFQGASYFRLIGPGLLYGLSARGLAIDTAEPKGEEFPVFREFWLIKPAAEENRLVIYALLDSPSISGAYRFEVLPGAPTEMNVEARLFARQDIVKLGVAPLTSMFMWGENHTRFVDDFRPEVHDSDGLLVAASNGEWIWRPLSNHRMLRVSSLSDENPRGFGLLQRDRDFEHYMDMEARYELRPSMWIMPQGDWGKGRIELVEIPSDSETNDNLVAYWVPAKAMKAGSSATYSYRLRSFDHFLPENAGAKVIRTRIGWGANPGQADPPPKSKRKFVVDFRGGELDNLSPDAPIEAVLQQSSGNISELTVRRLPDDRTWRASFKLEPDGNNYADMRLFLKLRDQRLSEVWSYVWYPDAL